MDDALEYIRDNCIKKAQTKDKTVHNLLLYFYAQRDKPEELMDFLKKEEMRKQERFSQMLEILRTQ